MAEWISVEDRLPTEEEYINVGNDGTETYSRILIAFKTETIDYELGCYDGYKWMNEWGNRSISDVIAWKRFVPKYPNSRKPTMAKKEFIEREALIEHMKDLPTWDFVAKADGAYEKATKYPEGMFNCDDVIASIENAPAADVVEMRGCEQCKFSSKTPNEYPCSHCRNCYIDQFKPKDAERKCEDA
jgi:hypothetical protein